MQPEIETKSTVIFEGNRFKVLCIMNGWATIFPANVKTENIREVIACSSAVRVKKLQKAARK